MRGAVSGVVFFLCLHIHYAYNQVVTQLMPSRNNLLLCRRVGVRYSVAGCGKPWSHDDPAAPLTLPEHGRVAF